MNEFENWILDFGFAELNSGTLIIGFSLATLAYYTSSYQIREKQIPRLQEASHSRHA
ncbi:hypothetical protein M422DRAFT_251066 [Sphaerobolus stellatus SS14]|uniref:Uncharacterized protein n=1 Tax=Sphaerobolus stellatus (strain SS14) TaxID=990650 RepID=A0A0C9VFJ1_SPHS4|nr:hypothetical protein M422DRAFT_251066 [Sphaerobolus stellatus SS14]